MKKVNKRDKKTLLPSFHMANIQNILTKTESGEIGMFIKVLEKMNFLREQCKEENPYFLALFETWIKDGTMEATRKTKRVLELLSILERILHIISCPHLAMKCVQWWLYISVATDQDFPALVHDLPNHMISKS